MHKTTQIAALALLAILFLGMGCKDKEVLEYDREALLSNIGDNVILPSYQTLGTAALSLQQDAVAFRASKGLSELDALQNSMLTLWTSWKASSPFEFGPAADRALRASLNTFPSDSIQIKSNITAGTWDFNLAANLDAKGFPAMDFMLFGLGADDNAILDRYLNPQDSAQYQNYLAALISDSKSLIESVRDEWQNSYLATFKASLGTDVGSGTSFLVNELNRDLEVIKTASIGIPIGKQTFGQALPGKCEALYSAHSISLIVAQLESIERIYKGTSLAGADGYGLKEALDALEAQYQGGSLTEAIDAQFTAAKSAAQAIPTPLSDAVVSNAPSVENAYTEVQKLVILLKTDMASAMSILITYTDADGD